MDFSPENISDRPTPSTNTSHRGSSSHTSFNSPDGRHSSQHRNYNGNTPHISHNTAASQATLNSINPNTNYISSETIVASPSQLFAECATFNHLAEDLYQPSLPGGGMTVAANTSAAGGGLDIPTTWDMNGTSATTGMSIGPETGWQFENLEWLAGAGV